MPFAKKPGLYTPQIRFRRKKFYRIKKTFILPFKQTLMVHSNKKKLNLLLFFAACVFISIAATKPTKSLSNQQLTKNDTGFFKNLKVLPKDISKEDLEKIMKNFNRSLGVKCNFCHAPGADNKLDFVSDAKSEKDVARYMINLTTEINTKYFNFENSTRPDTISIIKCVTCHHGSPHPADSVAAPGMPPPPPPPMHDSTGKMPPPPNQK